MWLFHRGLNCTPDICFLIRWILSLEHSTVEKRPFWVCPILVWNDSLLFTHSLTSLLKREDKFFLIGLLRGLSKFLKLDMPILWLPPRRVFNKQESLSLKKVRFRNWRKEGSVKCCGEVKWTGKRPINPQQQTHIWANHTQIHSSIQARHTKVIKT